MRLRTLFLLSIVPLFAVLGASLGFLKAHLISEQVAWGLREQGRALAIVLASQPLRSALDEDVRLTKILAQGQILELRLYSPRGQRLSLRAAPGSSVRTKREIEDSLQYLTSTSASARASERARPSATTDVGPALSEVPELGMSYWFGAPREGYPEILTTFARIPSASEAGPASLAIDTDQSLYLQAREARIESALFFGLVSALLGILVALFLAHTLRLPLEALRRIAAGEPCDSILLRRATESPIAEFLDLAENLTIWRSIAKDELSGNMQEPALTMGSLKAPSELSGDR
jgi:hypothetical protein